MGSARSLFEKIWDSHTITTNEAGQTLLFIDRHFCHELSFHAFNMLHGNDRRVRHPERTFAIPDHYTPTTGLNNSDYVDEDTRALVANLVNNAKRNEINLFDLDDERRGIIHVVGPEQGITQPGMIVVCGDSHTSTHGALGALAFGIGASDVSHVLATQTLWQPKPKSMRVNVTGSRPAGVTAKDVILAIIGHIGAAGGTGHAIEYAGQAIQELTVEERLTVCNMSIEAGARAGMIAPDETTYRYLRGRPYAPGEEDWSAAEDYWRSLTSDDDAEFDNEATLAAKDIQPMVTWGTSPEDVLPVCSSLPDPQAEIDPKRQAAMQRKMEYMGLHAGQAIEDIKVDRVFIGSCTNSRIEDLRDAARVLEGRTARIPAIIVPGSGLIRAQAEQEGLHKVFEAAGVDWRPEAGCSMCIGVNGDFVESQERCASTSNRNFEGRQGRGARTHLVSPAMAAAAAVTGHFTDVREMETP
ncbi:MAG: 3-isopropylmalate dehydratase large subunit [Rhodospirillaceae bacterium]|nr:3-isopropylmalate dehydratase large subunit [Rhodospirillaceae bacterium]|tara:strand:- start:6796 stop:8205 length:1410 start_codon:yes stop_codon:yes gene_type:complete